MDPRDQAKIAEHAALQGHSLVVLNGDDLVRLLHGAGGGLANGNTAMAHSLAAQSRTIQESSDHIRSLLVELDQSHKRIAQLERQSFEQQQFEAKMVLARETAARKSATDAEMLGLVKTAAVGLLTHFAGGKPMLPEVGSAGHAPGPGASRGEAGSVADAGPVGAASGGEAPSPQPPSGRPTAAAHCTLGGLLRQAVHQLSTPTLNALLEQAEQPSATLPNGIPALVAAAQVILGSLDRSLLERMRGEVDPELLGQLYALLMAHTQQGAPSA